MENEPKKRNKFVIFLISLLGYIVFNIIYNIVYALIIYFLGGLRFFYRTSIPISIFAAIYVAMLIFDKLLSGDDSEIKRCEFTAGILFIVNNAINLLSVMAGVVSFQYHYLVLFIVGIVAIFISKTDKK